MAAAEDGGTGQRAGLPVGKRKRRGRKRRQLTRAAAPVRLLAQAAGEWLQRDAVLRREHAATRAGGLQLRAIVPGPGRALHLEHSCVVRYLRVRQVPGRVECAGVCAGLAVGLAADGPVPGGAQRLHSFLALQPRP